MTTPVLGRQRQIHQRPHRTVGTQQRVGELQQLIAPGGEALVELPRNPASTPNPAQRSYGMALLRWFRFLWSVQIPWNEATRVEARDFSRWIQIADKPARPHWRSAPGDAPVSPPVVGRAPNAVTGKRPAGRGYALSTVAHCETVLRSFYSRHLEAVGGFR